MRPYVSNLRESPFKNGARLCRRPAAARKARSNTPGIQSLLRLVEDDTAAPRSFQAGLKCRAFTLIEMMVVIVLVSIMAAAIIPEMKGSFQDALLRSTGRDLINVFNLASSRAVSLDRACRVQLNSQERRYIVQRQIQDGMQQTYIDLRDVVGTEGKWDSRISVEIRHPGDNALNEENTPDVQAETTDMPDAISFFPDGTSDAAEIHLRDRQGFELILQLNPVTSRVHIVEPPEHQ